MNDGDGQVTGAGAGVVRVGVTEWVSGEQWIDVTYELDVGKLASPEHVAAQRAHMRHIAALAIESIQGVLARRSSQSRYADDGGPVTQCEPSTSAAPFAGKTHGERSTRVMQRRLGTRTRVQRRRAR